MNTTTCTCGNFGCSKRIARGLVPFCGDIKALRGGNGGDGVSVHALAAKLLGWTEEQCSSFSLRALRDVVRTAPPGKLRDEVMTQITAGEFSGRVVRGRDSKEKDHG